MTPPMTPPMTPLGLGLALAPSQQIEWDVAPGCPSAAAFEAAAATYLGAPLGESSGTFEVELPGGPASARTKGSEPARTLATGPVREGPEATPEPKLEDESKLRAASSPEVPIEVTPPAPRPRAKARDSNPTRPPLEELAQARAHLLAGEPAAVLPLVHARDYPASLEGRRVAMEISALCQLDRGAEAERRAAAWREAHPADPTAARLEKSAGDRTQPDGGGQLQT